MPIEQLQPKPFAVMMVDIQTKYGTERIYPACGIAELFCQLTKSKTLSRSDIIVIKELGFEVKVKQVQL